MSKLEWFKEYFLSVEAKDDDTSRKSRQEFNRTSPSGVFISHDNVLVNNPTVDEKSVVEIYYAVHSDGGIFLTGGIPDLFVPVGCSLDLSPFAPYRLIERRCNGHTS